MSDLKSLTAKYGKLTIQQLMERLEKCEAAIQAALDRDNELHPEHCPCELCVQLRAALEDR